MIKKLTLEQRISRLEELILHKYNGKNARKFESLNDIEPMCKRAFNMLQSSQEDYGLDVFGFANEGDHFVIDVQDITDGEYADDWDVNYETFGLYPNGDGSVTVSIENSYFNDPGNLAICNSASDIVKTILSSR